MVFVRPIYPSTPLTSIAPRPWLVALALAPTFNNIHVPRADRDGGPGPRGLKGAGAFGRKWSLVVDGEHRTVSVGTRATVIEAREGSWAVAVVARWALRRRSCSLGQTFVIAVIECPGLRKALPALRAVRCIACSTCCYFDGKRGVPVYCCLLVHITGVNASATAICARDQGATGQR